MPPKKDSEVDYKIACHHTLSADGANARLLAETELPPWLESDGAV